MRLVGIIREALDTRKSSIFVKLLLSFMLLNILNVLFAFGFYYWKSEGVMRSEIDLLSHRLLTQTQNISNYIYMATIKGGYDLYYDQYMYSAMFSGDNLDNYDQNKLTLHMNRFIQMNPVVQSIYLYNMQLGTVMSSAYSNSTIDHFPDKEMTEVVMAFKYDSPPVPYLLRTGASGQSGPVLSLIITEPSSDTDHIQGAMVINLNNQQLRNLVTEMSNDPYNELFILQEDGQFVTPPGSAVFDAGDSRFRYYDKLIASGGDSGTFVATMDKKQYVIAYQKTNLESTGFIYVSVYPYTKLFASLLHIRNLTLLTGACLIAASFAVSIVLSRRIYSPIRMLTQVAAKQLKMAKGETINGDIGTISHVLNEVIKKNENLESFSLRTRRLLRDQFLRSLLLGNDPGASLRWKSNDGYDTGLDYSEPVRVAVCRIDHYARFEDVHDEESRYLLRYAMLNIAEETLIGQSHYLPVDMGSDHFAIVMRGAEEEAQQEKLKLVQHNIREYLQIGTTIGIGELAAPMTESAFSYEGALAVSDYRIFSGPGAQLIYEEMRVQPTLEYPHDREKAIVDELKLGRPQKMEEKVDEFLNFLEKNPYRDMFSLVAQVMLNILKQIQRVPDQAQSLFPARYDDLYAELSRLESRDEIRAWMIERFTPVCEDKLDDKKHKNADTVEKGIRYIEEHYTESDFSVASVSEYLQYSVNHLNKLFNEVTGHTVHEWINRLRLERAKQLVLHSDRLINEIAQEAGFNSSNYFYFVFKKTFGMTPNSYRKMHQEETAAAVLSAKQVSSSEK